MDDIDALLRWAPRAPPPSPSYRGAECCSLSKKKGKKKNATPSEKLAIATVKRMARREGMETVLEALSKMEG